MLNEITLEPLNTQQTISKKQLKESYNEYWDNIRFKKGWEKPAFSKEDVAEYLDKVAEIVVRIRSALDMSAGRVSKSRILAGNAKEFMWSLSKNPVSDNSFDEFVRGIVHANFVDMDGYVEDLNEEYIDTQIERMMAFWASENKTLDAVNNISCGLKMICNFWDQFKTENDVEALTLEHERDILNISDHIALLLADFGALGRQEFLEEAQSEETESMDVDSDQDYLDGIKETNLIQINTVEKDITEISSKLKNIEEDVKNFQLDQGNYENAKVTLDSLLDKVSLFQFNLMNDMLELDSIIGDKTIRPLRKKQVVAIEGMLNDLDKIKAKLVSYEKTINAHIAEMEKENEQAEIDELNRLEKLAEMEEYHRQKDEEFENAEKEAKKNRQDSEMSDVEGDDLQNKWSQMRLSPQFTIERKKTAFIIESYIPGLVRDEIEVSTAGDSLTLAGLRLPNEREYEVMKQRIPNGVSDEEYESLMLRLGAGRYGRFSEIYELPEEADKENIRAAYQGGVFRIIVPLKKEFQRRPKKHPFYSDNNLWW